MVKSFFIFLVFIIIYFFNEPTPNNSLVFDTATGESIISYLLQIPPITCKTKF